MKKVILLLTTLLLLASCINSEANTRIQYVDRILSSYFIWGIAFESDGTAWMRAPDVGLIKYETDGTFEIFDHTNSIINEETYSIRDMIIDDQDRLWLGNDGLVCYDDGFTRYDSGNSTITGDHVNCMELDSEGKVWFSVSAERYNSGLGCFDQGNITMHIPENPGILRNIGDIAIDQDDQIWCSSMYTLQDTCLYKYDQLEWTIYDTVDIGFNPYCIQSLWINPENELIASISYALSSSVINKDAPLWFKFDGESFSIIENEHTIWPKAFMDNDGYFWSTPGNTLKVETEEGILQRTVLYEPYGIYGSPTGEIWVCSRNGVYIYRIGD